MRQGSFIHMQVDSPVGPLELTSNGEALCGVHMMGQDPTPSFAGSTGVRSAVGPCSLTDALRPPAPPQSRRSAPPFPAASSMLCAKS